MTPAAAVAVLIVYGLLAARCPIPPELSPDDLNRAMCEGVTLL